jgi:hypothetical protein
MCGITEQKWHFKVVRCLLSAYTQRYREKRKRRERRERERERERRKRERCGEREPEREEKENGKRTERESRRERAGEREPKRPSDLVRDFLCVWVGAKSLRPVPASRSVHPK